MKCSANVLFVFLCFAVCGCSTKYEIRTKQGDYNIVKADLQNEGCKLQKVVFQEQENGVFLEKSEFTKLANNISNMSFCYNNLFEKAQIKLNYYEEVIKSIGGSLE